MRIFFPALLLLVALIAFVISVGLLYRVIPHLYRYFVDTNYPLDTGHYLMWHIYPLSLGMMLSVCVANWAWKEIRREKTRGLE